MNKLLPALGAACLLSACQNQPLREADDDRLLRETATAGSALVTAGCVTRNQFGDDLLLLLASQTLSARLRDESLSALARAGLRPAPALSVLVCPGHVTGEHPALVVKPHRDSDQTLPTRYPIADDEALQADPALAAAYDALFRALVQSAAVRNGDAPPSPRQRLPLAITSTDLGLIRAHAGQPRLWVANGATGMVSFAKSFSTAMATGIATAMTFGIGFVSQPVNASYYGLDLVDLDRGERLWHSQLSGPGQPDLSGELRALDDEKSRALIDRLYAPLLPMRADEELPTPAGSEPASVAARPAAARQAAPPLPPTSAVPGARLLAAPLSLRITPKPDGQIAAELPVGSRVELVSPVDNSTGRWWFVKSTRFAGWLPEKELPAR